MHHEDSQNKELYTTKRMVHILEEVSEEELFDLEIPSLNSSIASAVLPPEEWVDRFSYKEDEENPLPILLSGSSEITVTEADIATLCREGIEVNEKTTLPLRISCILMMSFLLPHHPPLVFMASILVVRVGTSLLGGPS